jgi:hypothetical protein
VAEQMVRAASNRHGVPRRDFLTSYGFRRLIECNLGQIPGQAKSGKGGFTALKRRRLRKTAFPRQWRSWGQAPKGRAWQAARKTSR